MSALEREQAEALRRAAEHERARIARELHDVVTHNVSVMIIQAGAARKVMDTAPEQAREALLAVEAGGRAAMTELRHVMGLLTMDSATEPDPAGAARTWPRSRAWTSSTRWSERVRDTGVPVDLTVTGPPRPLPPGVELAAYRVVQEALTNTVKHAAGAAAAVTVDYGADQLRVEVTDTGGTPGARRGDRQRPRADRPARTPRRLRRNPAAPGRGSTGGYRVEALIPLEAP